MASKQRRTCFACFSALCLLICISLLTGCDSTLPGFNGTFTNATATPNLDGSPKGPGSANLTATALATPATPPACPALNAAPASTSGWKTYKDSQYSFQFAYPPGWHPNLSTGDTSDHTVNIFPPGSPIPPLGIAAGASEYFQISILLTGTPSDPAHDPNWQPILTNFSISGTKTTLYARPAVQCAEVDRMAVADFGQHHFSFYMTSKPAQAKQDITLFLGMLQSFTYTG